jgi:glutaredoxin
MLKSKVKSQVQAAKEFLTKQKEVWPSIPSEELLTATGSNGITLTSGSFGPVLDGLCIQPLVSSCYEESQASIPLAICDSALSGVIRDSNRLIHTEDNFRFNHAKIQGVLAVAEGNNAYSATGLIEKRNKVDYKIKGAKVSGSESSSQHNPDRIKAQDGSYSSPSSRSNIDSKNMGRGKEKSSEVYSQGAIMERLLKEGKSLSKRLKAFSNCDLKGFITEMIMTKLLKYIESDSRQNSDSVQSDNEKDQLPYVEVNHQHLSKVTDPEKLFNLLKCGKEGTAKCIYYMNRLEPSQLERLGQYFLQNLPCITKVSGAYHALHFLAMRLPFVRERTIDYFGSSIISNSQSHFLCKMIIRMCRSYTEHCEQLLKVVQQKFEALVNLKYSSMVVCCLIENSQKESSYLFIIRQIQNNPALLRNINFLKILHSFSKCCSDSILQSIVHLCSKEISSLFTTIEGQRVLKVFLERGHKLGIELVKMTLLRDPHSHFNLEANKLVLLFFLKSEDYSDFVTMFIKKLTDSSKAFPVECLADSMSLDILLILLCYLPIQQLSSFCEQLEEALCSPTTLVNFGSLAVNQQLDILQQLNFLLLRVTDIAEQGCGDKL